MDGATPFGCPAHVPHKDEPPVQGGDIRDSELVRRDGDWYVYLVVKRPVTVHDEHDDVLLSNGRTLGRHLRFLSDRKTIFYGEEVRHIREHHKRLRESIGKAKPRQGQQAVERIGDAEAWTVGDRLHKIARQIVEDAEKRNAITIVGNLGGIRKDNDKGRYLNDKTQKMPFARLLNYIKYKPHDAGIDVRWSKNTTRRKRATAVAVRASERRRDGSSVLTWAGRQRREERCVEDRQASLGQVLETAVRRGGWAGTARNAGHRPS